MPRRPAFEPDVTLGDLLVLARLGALAHGDERVSTTNDSKKAHSASDIKPRTNAALRKEQRDDVDAPAETGAMLSVSYPKQEEERLR